MIFFLYDAYILLSHGMLTGFHLAEGYPYTQFLEYPLLVLQVSQKNLIKIFLKVITITFSLQSFVWFTELCSPPFAGFDNVLPLVAYLCHHVLLHCHLLHGSWCRPKVPHAARHGGESRRQ